MVEAANAFGGGPEDIEPMDQHNPRLIEGVAAYAGFVVAIGAGLAAATVGNSLMSKGGGSERDRQLADLDRRQAGASEDTRMSADAANEELAKILGESSGSQQSN